MRTFVMTLRREDPRGLPVTDEARQRAYEALKKETRQDFGYEAEKWEKWLRDNLAEKYY